MRGNPGKIVCWVDELNNELKTGIVYGKDQITKVAEKHCVIVTQVDPERYEPLKENGKLIQYVKHIKELNIIGMVD